MLHTYQGLFSAFGDSWRTCSEAIQTAAELNKDIALCTYTVEGKDRAELYAAILAELEGGERVHLTVAPTGKRIELYTAKRPIPVPTKRKWKPIGNLVTYQLCSGSFGVRSDVKDPTEKEANEFLAFLASKWEVKKLGLPMKVSEIVELASRSLFFVGVSSGMMQVAHSLNMRRYLMTYDVPEDWDWGFHPPTVTRYPNTKVVTELLKGLAL